MERGDFKRWGARSGGGGTNLRGFSILGITAIIAPIVEIHRLEEEYGPLPTEVHLGLMSGELDYQTVDRYYPQFSGGT